jgi:hypothetical protein
VLVLVAEGAPRSLPLAQALVLVPVPSKRPKKKSPLSVRLLSLLPVRAWKKSKQRNNLLLLRKRNNKVPLPLKMKNNLQRPL